MKGSFATSVSVAALVAVAASTSVRAQEQATPAPVDEAAPVAADNAVADAVSPQNAAYYRP